MKIVNLKLLFNENSKFKIKSKKNHKNQILKKSTKKNNKKNVLND